MRSNKYLITALVFALLTGLITYQFLQNINKRESIVIARTSIPKYSYIDSSMVEVKSVHPSGVQPEAVRGIEEVAGSHAITDLIPGEHIISSKITSQDDYTNFASRLKTDERAIFIPLTLNQGLGGALTIDDLIDIVFVSFDGQLGFNVSKTILQRVSVLDVRNDSGRSIDGGDRTQSPSGVIVAVSPKDIEKIAYCLEYGQIYISKQPFTGEKVITDGVFYENVFKD